MVCGGESATTRGRLPFPGIGPGAPSREHLLLMTSSKNLPVGLPCFDCTVPPPTPRETANVKMPPTVTLGTSGLGRRWQVVCCPEDPGPWFLSRSRGDSRLLEGKLKFWGRYLSIKGLHQILGGEVDSRLRFDRHPETVVRRASPRGPPAPVRHPPRVTGPMRLYKAQMELGQGYSPPPDE
ncbi:hypothetical protein GWK47_011212 [Chionoecetes opilio]|uniref:Uncharacterized protein n=1 Tax=Chionoecetes opilio TaxID=41210 RepID=A0A8J5CNJ1_CHIOP|nr:hypothetical protein GWK47_011212 [Chionoecetes opilio]